MKLKKRKLKFAAIFGICWFALLVLLVDGILKFKTLVDYFGSYALVEISLLRFGGDFADPIGRSTYIGGLYLH